MSDEAILSDLRSDDVEVIREAAWQAGEARCAACVPLLAEHLKSANLGVQEAADTALRKIRGQETVQAVIPLLRSEEAPVRNLSMDILRAVGDEDFPSLIALLHDEDVDIRIFAADILGSTDNVLAVDPLCRRLLRDPEVNVRYQAAVSLGNLGFRQAAPSLNKAMVDEEWVQFAVIEALVKIRDESSVKTLTDALDSSTDLVASMLVDALGEMGNLKAVAVLLRKMHQAPTAMRNKIVKAVVRIMGGKSLALLSDEERDKFRQYLLVALEDEDVEVQDAAVQGLASVGGEEAAAAILRLASMLDPDLHHDRLLQAIEGLAAIGMNPALERALRADDQKAALITVEAISRLDEVDGPAAVLLMDVFWGKDREVQRELVKALIAVGGPDSKDFFLDVLARHKDGTVLKGALYFLGEKCQGQDVSDALFAMLEHDFDDVKEAALEACISIDGPEMEARFRELFGNPDPVQRMMAVYAMGKFGFQDHWEDLRLALEDEVPDIRKIAVESLNNVCYEHDDWLEMVIPRLQDEHREVRLTVVDLLGTCLSEAAVEHLLMALDDDDDWVRIRAVESLGVQRMTRAVSRLTPLLDESNTLLVIKVVEALGNIGGQEAFKALFELVNREDPEIQSATEEALLKIRENQAVDD